ncbi:unnamed protein product [Lampetra fluviatilis]
MHWIGFTRRIFCPQSGRTLACTRDSSRYSQYKMEHVLDSLGWLLKEVDSSFLIYLTMLPWLPTEAVWPPGSTLPSFGRACDLYLRVSNLRRLLGCHAAYLALEMSANSMLAGDLSEHSECCLLPSCWHRVRERQDPRFSLRELPHYNTGLRAPRLVTTGGAVEEEGVSIERGVPFCTASEHIHTVYEYLQAECSNQQLQDLFRYHPAVFQEGRRQHSESGESGSDVGDDAMQGCFRYLHEVCWPNPTWLFLRYASLQHEVCCRSFGSSTAAGSTWPICSCR